MKLLTTTFVKNSGINYGNHVGIRNKSQQHAFSRKNSSLRNKCTPCSLCSSHFIPSRLHKRLSFFSSGLFKQNNNASPLQSTQKTSTTGKNPSKNFALTRQIKNFFFRFFFWEMASRPTQKYSTTKRGEIHTSAAKHIIYSMIPKEVSFWSFEVVYYNLMMWHFGE